MLKAKLVVVGGEAKQTEVRLKVLPTIIGRGREATLTLPHPLVSRQHCEIFEENGRLYVKDLSSLNGTYLNNERIEGQQPFDPDQLLTLGNVTFRAVYEIAAEFAETQQPAAAPVLPQPPSVSPIAAAVKMEPVEVEFEEIVPDDSQAVSADVDRKTDPGELAPCESEIPVAQVKKQPDLLASDTGELSAVDAGKADDSTSSESTDSSDLLVGEDLQEVAEKSISDSAISHLPAANEALSFAGGFEMLDAEKLALEQVEAIQIDLGESSSKPDEPSSTELDSFVRKLPK